MDDPDARDGWASSPAVRASMRANRRRDTTPELALRRAVHALGLRYRVDHAPLPEHRRRRADLVFTRARVAVFLDGCFWHGCPQHHSVAKTNAAFWADKVAVNRRRDDAFDAVLAGAGWLSIRIWEHDDPRTAALRIQDAVTGRRSDGRAT